MQQKGSAVTVHNDLYSDRSIADTADALVEIADLALAFGRVDRTGPCHPDGTPESDSDHTVMLGWVAPALADLVNERMGFPHYDVDLVASYALVHDAAEVYAGDTCTVRITEDELADKADREAVATVRLSKQFDMRLPWFAKMAEKYEEQDRREAKFVRAVDKVLPKMVHLVDKRIGLKKEGVSRAEFLTLIARQRKQVADNVRAGLPLVLGVYDLLCERVLADWPPDEHLPQPTERHWVEMGGNGVRILHENCSHEHVITCPFTVAWEMCERYSNWPAWLVNAPTVAKYEVALDERGLLTNKKD